MLNTPNMARCISGQRVAIMTFSCLEKFIGFGGLSLVTRIRQQRQNKVGRVKTGPHPLIPSPSGGLSDG